MVLRSSRLWGLLAVLVLVPALVSAVAVADRARVRVNTVAGGRARGMAQGRLHAGLDLGFGDGMGVGVGVGGEDEDEDSAVSEKEPIPPVLPTKTEIIKDKAEFPPNKPGAPAPPPMTPAPGEKPAPAIDPARFQQVRHGFRHRFRINADGEEEEDTEEADSMDIEEADKAESEDKEENEEEGPAKVKTGKKKGGGDDDDDEETDEDKEKAKAKTNGTVVDRKSFPSKRPPPMRGNLKPPLCSPGRWLFTMVLIVDKIYVFGGVGAYSHKFWTDLWSYDKGMMEWRCEQRSYIPPFPNSNLLFPKPPNNDNYRPAGLPVPPPFGVEPMADADEESINRPNNPSMGSAGKELSKEMSEPDPSAVKVNENKGIPSAAELRKMQENELRKQKTAAKQKKFRNSPRGRALRKAKLKKMIANAKRKQKAAQIAAKKRFDDAVNAKAELLHRAHQSQLTIKTDDQQPGGVSIQVNHHGLKGNVEKEEHPEHGHEHHGEHDHEHHGEHEEHGHGERDEEHGHGEHDEEHGHEHAHKHEREHEHEHGHHERHHKHHRSHHKKEEEGSGGGSGGSGGSEEGSGGSGGEEESGGRFREVDEEHPARARFVEVSPFTGAQRVRRPSKATKYARPYRHASNRRVPTRPTDLFAPSEPITSAVGFGPSFLEIDSQPSIRTKEAEAVLRRIARHHRHSARRFARQTPRGTDPRVAMSLFEMTADTTNANSNGFANSNLNGAFGGAGMVGSANANAAMGAGAGMGATVGSAAAAAAAAGVGAGSAAVAAMGANAGAGLQVGIASVARHAVHSAAGAKGGDDDDEDQADKAYVQDQEHPKFGTPFVGDETWMLSVDTRRWTLIPKTAALGAAFPQPRWLHSAVVMDDKMVIFGGVNPDSVILGDIWMFAPSTYKWTEAKVEGVPILPREGHSAVAVGNSMIVFGGISYAYSPFNDVWTYLSSENKWVMNKPSGNKPAPRWMHSAVLHTAKSGGRSMFIFGGITHQYVPLNDLWALSIESMTWSQPKTSGVAPFPRMLHAAVIFEDTMFVHGGAANNLMHEDFWKLDLSADEPAWEEMLPAGWTPMARMGHAMVVVAPPTNPTPYGDDRPAFTPPDTTLPPTKVPQPFPNRPRKESSTNRYLWLWGGVCNLDDS